MSRDFEKEYKDYMNKDIPDLWNRIEAGLSERSAPSLKEEAPVKVYKIALIKALKKNMGLLGAAICLIMIIPAAMLAGRLGQMNTKSSADIADIGDVQEESAAAYDMTEGTAAETGAAQMSAADAAPEAEAVPEAEAAYAGDGAPVAEFITEGDQGVSVENSAPKQEKKAAKDREDVNEKAIQNLEDNTTWEIKATVLSVQAADSEEAGTLYKVRVTEDPAGIFATDEEIVLYAPLYCDSIMFEGETRTVTVKYDSKAVYPYEYIK